jgi:hypothetical protein
MSAPAEVVAGEAGPPAEGQVMGGRYMSPAMLENMGKGRQRGAINITTRESRKIGAMLAEREADNFSAWLAKVAETRPDRACELYLELLRIVIPAKVAASIAAGFVAPDGTQSAVVAKVRGLFGLPSAPLPIEGEPQ